MNPVSYKQMQVHKKTQEISGECQDQCLVWLTCPDPTTKSCRNRKNQPTADCLWRTFVRSHLAVVQNDDPGVFVVLLLHSVLGINAWPLHLLINKQTCWQQTALVLPLVTSWSQCLHQTKLFLLVWLPPSSYYSFTTKTCGGSKQCRKMYKWKTKYFVVEDMFVFRVFVFF